MPEIRDGGNAGGDDAADAPREQIETRRIGPLPGGVRFVLFVVGTLLVAIGVIGLALPVVPQTLPLALGVTLLSLASDWVHRRLRSLFRRWPRGWRIVQSLRRRLHRWLAQ